MNQNQNQENLGRFINSQSFAMAKKFAMASPPPRGESEDQKMVGRRPSSSASMPKDRKWSEGL